MLHDIRVCEQLLIRVMLRVERRVARINLEISGVRLVCRQQQGVLTRGVKEAWGGSASDWRTPPNAYAHAPSTHAPLTRKIFARKLTATIGKFKSFIMFTCGWHNSRVTRQNGVRGFMKRLLRYIIFMSFCMNFQEVLSCHTLTMLCCTIHWNLRHRTLCYFMFFYQERAPQLI